jgi:hypothetical protein
MKLQLVRVESKQALDFGDDYPLWYVHGVTTGGMRYVYKPIFNSQHVADKAVAGMTDGNGKVVTQILNEWHMTCQRIQL